MEIGKISKPSIGNAREYYLAALLSPLNPAMPSLPFVVSSLTINITSSSHLYFCSIQIGPSG